MKVIIIEDEPNASLKLESMLKKSDPDLRVIARLESVEDTVNWIRKNPAPDLGFFDIQLADDVSFEIFEQCRVEFPVIFITAYDDYLLKAFEYNSVHYLLKPVTSEKIFGALQKVKQLERHFVNAGLHQYLADKRKNKYNTNRLVVRRGMDFVPLEVVNIAYAFSEHKICFVRDRENNTFMIDKPLSQMQTDLDPAFFFRANRQFLVNINAIRQFKTVDHGKILLKLAPETKEAVVIAKENAADFRKWIKN